MPPPSILILTALEFEARPIARALHLTLHRPSSSYSSPNSPIRIHVVGPRAIHLPPAPPSGSCRAVIMAGLAGALSPTLGFADLALDDQSTLPLLPSDDLPRLPFHTSPTPVSTPAEKRQLHLATGSHIVEMENAIARAWASSHHLPFAGIRAISDTSCELLHPATSRIIDHRGQLRPLRLVSELLQHPPFLLHLLRLRKTSVAVDRLARAVAAIAQSVARST